MLVGHTLTVITTGLSLPGFRLKSVSTDGWLWGRVPTQMQQPGGREETIYVDASVKAAAIVGWVDFGAYPSS